MYAQIAWWEICNSWPDPTMQNCIFITCFFKNMFQLASRHHSRHFLKGKTSQPVFFISTSGYLWLRIASSPRRAQITVQVQQHIRVVFLSTLLLADSLIHNIQSNLKSIKSAIRRADNELLCEALEPTPLGSCLGRREAMTDHILGLESKISSLFSLHSPPGDHKRTLYIWFGGNLLNCY